MPGVIRYWIDQTNEYPLCYSENGKETGLYAELLQKLSDLSGSEYEFRRISANDGSAITAADALDMLKTGSLEMVLGLPAEIIDSSLSYQNLYSNTLTAVTMKGAPQAPHVENCYWGIDSALIGLTEDTALDGHVLDYNGTASLFDALESGAVYGILIRRSLLDGYVHFEKGSDFGEYAGIKLPYTECVCYDESRLADAVTANIRDISEELREKYASYSVYDSSVTTGVGANDTLAPYYNKLNDAYSKLSFTGTAAYFGIAGAVLFGILAGVLFSRLKKYRSLNESRLRTLLDEEPDKELFEIDLKAKTIRAYKDFSLFGVRPGSIKNPIRLDALSELMGYDFTSHFSKVSLYGNTIYKNRFIIYAGGKKLYIAESGRRTGHILTVTMTLLKL